MESFHYSEEIAEAYANEQAEAIEQAENEAIGLVVAGYQVAEMYL
jgi:hypothetical protein